jgi:hypothetical protein
MDDQLHYTVSTWLFNPFFYKDIVFVLLLVSNNLNAPRSNGVLDRFLQGVAKLIDLWIGGM